MSLEHWSFVVALASFCFTIGGLIWISAVTITNLKAEVRGLKEDLISPEKLAAVCARVEIIWQMLLRRAAVEGVHAGLMEVHSPVRLIGDSGKLLEHMADDLHIFYKENCQDKGEHDIALAIENAFGDRLVKEVCIPNKISFGVCILIAVAIAKNVDSLTEILNQNEISDKHEKI